MNLLIVESPAKAKTLKKYLGKDFQILASYGHVRDLVPKEGAIDTDHDFAMKYTLIDKNTKHVDAIAKAVKKADQLYLATDPDREGEAISWHLQQILQDRNLLKDKPVHRVVFHEITKRAVQDAVEHPRDLSADMIDAQQARRALDYLVGFNLSPLLWKKVRRGLSAGRVQSPALRMIVEREEEIEKFVSREYWSMEASVQKDAREFKARLAVYAGEKQTQFSIENEQDASAIEQALRKAANGKLVVEQVQKKQRKRNPAPPFTTSTLQQEAARKLGFTTQRTMRVAQQLYEGVDIDGSSTGLITYMRTDSVSLANEALDQIRALIADRYGADDVPAKPRLFKTRSKNAQEAHEAVRPTSVELTPEKIRKHLSAEQAKLYELIWKRTVACQMVHATIDTVTADLGCGEGNQFRATGSTIRDHGFMKVYLEGVDDARAGDDDEKLLPPLKEGETVKLLDITGHQHFTEPPPRYSEASLVKALEEYGIGRPSTYASIISTLQQREYVELVNKRFHPTDVGRVVNRFLTEHFTRYVDYDFTAKLEDELDAVSRGEKDWIPLMKDFWGRFKDLVDDKEQSVKRSDVTQEPLDEACPKCGKQLSIRLGRRGRFVGCTAYPECDYTRNLDGDSGEDDQEIVEGRTCPECESPLLVRHGRYGKFIGCSGYPKCRYMEPLEKPEDTGVECPQCHKGNLLKRKSRRGKVFFSCSTYPDCDYAVWNQPIDEPCPTCAWPITTLKVTKRRGAEKVCPRKSCDYSEPAELPEGESTTGKT